MTEVLSIVLGGGKGTRLYPLTKERAKPAVPFGAKYRLVDIPISNCINSGFKKVYVLTQFNTASLHLHIGSTYQFDSFTNGFVEILAAEQTLMNNDWYMGTADAVRKNFVHFHTQKPTHYIILSGDQLYRMDLKRFFKEHVESKADVTVASTPVDRNTASDLGLLQLDNKEYINEFLEKPGLDGDVSDYVLSDSVKKKYSINGNKDYLASMGIYIFNAKAMEDSLNNEFTDFGKEIIPRAISNMNVRTHIYQGYWEDIGTIRNFYDSNLDLTSPCPKFNLQSQQNKLFTHRRDLPAPKINASCFRHSIAGDGSIVCDGSISKSIIGIRSVLHKGVSLDGVYFMGADYYENNFDKNENLELNRPNLGLGEGSSIKGAIIDKNSRIGSDCRIGIDDIQRIDGDYGEWYIRDGIIVIPKGAIIQPGTVI